MNAIPAPQSGHPEAPLRLAILVASVRRERVGGSIAAWVAGRVPDRWEIDLIDLTDVSLAADALLQPGGGPTTDISARIAAADAYLIVTPEYNHSYPGTLKRVIDWHYREWQLKPAAFVSYGSHGGLLAVEHLRGVFAELHVVTTRRVVGVAEPWAATEDGAFVADDKTEDATARMVAELEWWARTLQGARAKRPFPT